MNTKFRWLFACLCLMTATSDAANAQTSDWAPRAGSWFTQNGPILVNFLKESEVSVNGAKVDVEANPDNNVTMSNAIGYNFTSNFSAQLVLGVTPDTDVSTQTGTRLGAITYGAPSILFDYRLTNFGAFQPFVGIGGMYIFVSEERDGALTNLKVDNTFGLILRAGSELMFNEHFGIYLATNKILAADMDATGYLGTSKVDATLELDPWIHQFGVTYRF